MMMLPLLILTVLPSSLQFIAGPVMGNGTVTVRDIIPLGVDMDHGVVAMKVVTTAIDYDDVDSSSLTATKVKAFDCHYKGMQGKGFDGVELMLLQVTPVADASKTWKVYSASHAQQACTLPESSTRWLGEAKAAFAKAGIVADKPVAYAAAPHGGRIKLPNGVEVTIAEETLACDDERRTCDAGEAIRELSFLAKGQTFHAMWSFFKTEHAGAAHFTVLGAFVAGNKALFVVRFDRTVGMEGPFAADSSVAVTPVFDLKP